WVRAGRWVRRHPSWVTGLVSGLLVFLLLGGAGALWWGRESERQRAAAEAALYRVEALQRLSRLEEAHVVLGQAEGQLGGFASADLVRRVRQARARLDLVMRLDAIRLSRTAAVQGRHFDNGWRRGRGQLSMRSISIRTSAAPTPTLALWPR